MSLQGEATWGRIVGDPIGMTLGRGADLVVQRVLPQAGASVGITSGDASFATLMQAQVDARLAARGITLPTTPADLASSSATAHAESAEDIWKRVQLHDAATNGQGDAIMAALRQASDERWERTERMRHGGADLSDFF